MIKKILKKIYKDDIATYEEMYNKGIETSISLKRANEKLEQEKADMEKVLDRIFSFQFQEIIGYESNKDEKVFIVKSETEKDLELYLYSSKYMSRNPRIMTTKINRCYQNENSDKSSLWIDDFCAIDEDLGNGTILMNYLIKIAEKRSYLYVKGMLSKVDKNRFDKLEYFYGQKFGFDVIYNDESCSEGRIIKKIK